MGIITRNIYSSLYQDAPEPISDHSSLINRSAANQHPISAITDLANQLSLRATLTQLDTKVDKITGMGLSTNDFTNAQVIALNNWSTQWTNVISPHIANTEIHVTATDKTNWNGKISSIAVNTFTGATSLQFTGVGVGTITQAGNVITIPLPATGTFDHSVLTSASRNLADQHPISAITGLQTQLTTMTTATTTAQTTANTNASNLATHIADTVVHITAAERTSWSGRELASNKVTTIRSESTATNTAYPSELATRLAINVVAASVQTVSDNLATLTTNFNTHNTDGVRHITAAERTTWNGKIDASLLVTSVRATATATNTNFPSELAVRNAIEAATGGTGQFQLIANMVTTLNNSTTQYPSCSAVTTVTNSLSTSISTHTARTDNPHSVTATQVGLGNVNNTSDANKPVSNATQTALNLKIDASLLDATMPATGALATRFISTLGAKTYIDNTFAGAVTTATNQTSGLTGNKTWSGTHIFSLPITVGTPTATGHATTKTYVDTADNLRELLSNKVTTIRAVATATNTAYPTELAVRTELNKVQTRTQYTNTNLTTGLIITTDLTSTGTYMVTLRVVLNTYSSRQTVDTILTCYKTTTVAMLNQNNGAQNVPLATAYFDTDGFLKFYLPTGVRYNAGYVECYIGIAGNGLDVNHATGWTAVTAMPDFSSVQSVSAVLTENNLWGYTRTIYVNPETGDDDNNSGSAALPYKTLTKALTTCRYSLFTVIYIGGSGIINERISQSYLGYVVLSSLAGVNQVINASVTIGRSLGFYWTGASGTTITVNPQLTTDGTTNEVQGIYFYEVPKPIIGVAVTVQHPTKGNLSSYGIQVGIGSDLYCAGNVTCKGVSQGLRITEGAKCYIVGANVILDKTGNGSTTSYPELVYMTAMLQYAPTTVVTRTGFNSTYYRGLVLQGDVPFGTANDVGVALQGSGKINIPQVNLVVNEYEQMKRYMRVNQAWLGGGINHWTGDQAFYQGQFRVSTGTTPDPAYQSRILFDRRLISIPTPLSVSSAGYVGGFTAPANGTVIPFMSGWTPTGAAGTVTDPARYAYSTTLGFYLPAYHQLFFRHTVGSTNLAGSFLMAYYTPDASRPNNIQFNDLFLATAEGESGAYNYSMKLCTGETIYAYRKITIATGGVQATGYDDCYATKNSSGVVRLGIAINRTTALAALGTLATIADTVHRPRSQQFIIGYVSSAAGVFTPIVFNVTTGGLIQPTVALVANTQVWINDEFSLR